MMGGRFSEQYNVHLMCLPTCIIARLSRAFQIKGRNHTRGKVWTCTNRVLARDFPTVSPSCEIPADISVKPTLEACRLAPEHCCRRCQILEQITTWSIATPCLGSTVFVPLCTALLLFHRRHPPLDGLRRRRVHSDRLSLSLFLSLVSVLYVVCCT